MSARFRGTKDLEVEVEWRYRFIGPGEKAETTPGIIYLDTGGQLAPGVIDHHGLAGDTCTASLLLAHRELAYNHLLKGILTRSSAGERLSDTRLALTVICHSDPDFDATVAVHLLRRLIEDGDFPSYAGALAAYAREVDQGRATIVWRSHAKADHRFTVEELIASARFGWIHLAHLAVQNVRTKELLLPSDQKLARGLELLDYCAGAIRTARGDAGDPRTVADFGPEEPGVAAWREAEPFRDLARLLDEDSASFREDFDEVARGGGLRYVDLPAADGGTEIRISAFIAGGEMKSALNRYWTRALGFSLAVIPYGPVPAKEGVLRFERVVISLDPNFSTADGRKPSLYGLGFRLEQAEAAARRRAGSGYDDREGPPRYPDGYCANADPWYDGRGHEWSIVDAPRAGTWLSYDEVCNLATGGEFWKIPLTSGTLTLVWSGAKAELAQNLCGLPEFEGMAPALGPFCRDSRQASEVPVYGETAAEVPTLEIRERRRAAPGDLCPPLRIVTVRTKAAPGATLEELVRCRTLLVRDQFPDFCLARVQLGCHFSAPGLVDRLLQELGGKDLKPFEAASSADALVMTSGRSLIFHRLLAGGPAPAGDRPDPEVEVLLYFAFLDNTLAAFSRRLGAMVPPERARIEPENTAALREDFLRFQALYYQLEVSRSSRSRAIFRELSASLDLPGHYDQVRSELDRLGELEERLAGERAEAAAKALEVILFVLAVGGTLQTLAVFLGWNARDLPRLGVWSAVLVGFLWLVYYLKVVRGRRRIRRGSEPAEED